MRLKSLLMMSVLGLAVAVPSFAAETTISTPISTVNNKENAKLAEKTTAPVNINTADAQTIAKGLTGVGKKRAEAIVAYRTNNGPFKSANDLTNIKGISKKVIEKNNGKILVK